MENNKLNTKNKWETANTSQFSNRTALMLNGYKVIVLEHYLENDSDRHKIEKNIIEALNNYDSLLEALKELVNDHEHHYAISFVDDAIISKAKEAILKAETKL